MIVTSQTKLLQAVAEGQDITLALTDAYSTAKTGVYEIVAFAVILHCCRIGREILFES